MTQPRILFLDIETFPNIGYTWGKYEQTVIKYTQERVLACYAWKWLGRRGVSSRGLPDYSGYKAGSYDDKALVKELWKLMDEADVIIAHNGDSFDVRVCNACFIRYNLPPPSPFRTVDTKKAVKRVAMFNSNKLDDLGETLDMGRKIKTDFELWEGCIRGDMKAWSRMLRYNRQDILLLEKLYLRIRPWTKNHPPVSADDGCPKCGSENTQYRGYLVTTTRRYRRFQCIDCGGWGRDVNGEKISVVVNA